VRYFWDFLGWLWSQKVFFLCTAVSALLCFIWFFPFSDLSDLVTSTVAKGTGNKIYLQFETLDLNLLPTPAISGNNVSLETPALPAIEAKWMKISPSWLSILFNAWTLKKAGTGDPEATAKLISHLGVTVSAQGLLGADVEMKIRPGSASEQGAERSKVSLFIEQLNLGEFQKWSDLPLKMQGQAALDTNLQFTPSLAEQPDGEIDLRMTKFSIQAGTVMVPFEGASMPISIPSLTLANVVLRGHLGGGKLTIDEGQFGTTKDPLNGRIKGQMNIRFMAVGPQIQPQMGPYNLTVELNVSPAVEKEIGFAFLIFDSTKTPSAAGSHYLFSAAGQSFGPPPSISRLNSF
jgi:hypothetical protein